VEGATGEWAQRVYDSALYADSFPAASRKSSLRWLQLHAAYDDEHPWEALEIVCTLLGTSPTVANVEHIAECIKRTYACMRVFGDRCLKVADEQGEEYRASAVAA
jgi:pyrroloquinoline quinone (PQQ) biosynthesis protein C